MLDFGLAKVFGGEVAGSARSESPTITLEATATGVIMGTAAYMSPEQARGKPLDKRTDIWSFGCCLYEALSGRAVFLRETISDTTACRRATIGVTSSTLCRSNLVTNSPTTRSSSPLGKAVAVDEAIEFAMKIAEARENAHEQGIVHRDLKPANIKITPDGNVKVLDFGLAKAFIEDAPDADSSMSPTLTRDATRAGVILGTAAYMSPEQAKGKKVDKRADVWAFGAVVYEMVTGKRAFAAEDVSDTLAYVLAKEADWDALPVDISPTLRAFLTRCLEKDPKERVHDIADVRLAMQGAFETAAAPATDSTPSWKPPKAA